MARLTKKKKIPKTFSRRARTGFAAAPTTSFQHFYDYVRLEVDKKDISGIIKTYIKNNFSKKEVKLLLAAPDWAYTMSSAAASAIYCKNANINLPGAWNFDKVIAIAMNNIRSQAIKNTEKKEEKVKIVSKSPMDIVKEKTSEFIAEIEEVLDLYNTDVYVDWENYSVYNELQKIDAPYNMAKKTLDYYQPLYNEVKELIEKKTPDLVEGYSHLSVRQRKEYMGIIQNILDDCNRYMASKKAVRKTRKPRVKSADKQVEKVNYLNESAEYKITSIHPSLIVGARRVYLFNTKTRMLSELISRLPNGFEVNGTTIKGIDEESKATRLRNPMTFLPIVLSKTPRQIAKEWSGLTTKNQSVNGRINKDTIILRALEK